jgi:general secretion pathway protein G
VVLENAGDAWTARRRGDVHLRGRAGLARPDRDGGFTLMELLIVMVLIMILAGVGLAIYNNSIVQAKESVLAQDLYQMREAIDRYYADKNKWPASLDTLVAEKYLRAIPIDPITNAADWRTTFGEPDPSNPSAEPGISDVHSNSDQISPLKNTAYSEW